MSFRHIGNLKMVYLNALFNLQYKKFVYASIVKIKARKRNRTLSF